MTNTLDDQTATEPIDFTAERERRKASLTAAFRIFGRLGFSEGAAGHITVRDPQFPDRFWVNPFQANFRLITAEQLLCVDAHGDVVEGSGMLNRAAFAIHSRIHHARPDAMAAAHAHSIHGKAFSALHRELRALTQDACIFFEDHHLFDDYTGLVWDESEGDRIAAALGDAKAAILANHGLLTVGRTVEEATYWFVSMERTCQVELAVLAAGGGVPMSDEVARETHKMVGSPAAGHFSAKPLFDWIRAECPDLD